MVNCGRDKGEEREDGRSFAGEHGADICVAALVSMLINGWGCGCKDEVKLFC